MSREYNRKYRKGKYTDENSLYKRNRYGLTRSQRADKAKWASVIYFKERPGDVDRWLRDTRQSDLMGVDTPPQKGQRVFNYKSRSKKRLGKKPGRENKHWRRYWYGKKI